MRQNFRDEALLFRYRYFLNGGLSPYSFEGTLRQAIGKLEDFKQWGYTTSGLQIDYIGTGKERREFEEMINRIMT